MAETVKIENRGKVKITPSGSIFFIIHLLPLLVLVPGLTGTTGVTVFDWGIGIFLYFLRMYFFRVYIIVISLTELTKPLDGFSLCLHFVLKLPYKKVCSGGPLTIEFITKRATHLQILIL